MTGTLESGNGSVMQSVWAENCLQLPADTREEFSYTLDTFPVHRHKELAAFGEFQSKRKTLEKFKLLAKS